MIGALILKLWKPLAGVVLVLALVGYLHHRERVAFQNGYQQATSEDAKVLAEKLAENAEREKTDAQRITNAYKDREAIARELDVIRARPVPALVCHRAPSRRKPVPERASISDPEVADPGALSAGTGEGTEPEFDPVPALIAMADSADSLLADCRMLHQSVHGVPTGP